IDLLAWHEATRSVLIIEVKTELTSVEETLRRLDVKRRLTPQIVREELGWAPTWVSCVLLLPEESTARRRVAEHAATFGTRFPDSARKLRSWLRAPLGAFAAVWFLSPTPTVGSKRV